MERERTLVKPLIKYPEGQIPETTTMPPRKTAEEKRYYVLIRFNGNVDETTWEECYGRSEATHVARQYVLEGADLERSLVFVEDGTVDPKVSLYWFLKMMESYFPDPNFDVEDYMAGDPESTVEASKTEIPTQVSSVYSGATDDGDRDI